MPRTTEANQRIREAQRAKILESARSVFARKGMEATITDIATEAQISIGLAYRYFADKEAIFSALVKQTIPAEFALVPAAFGDAWDARETSCRSDFEHCGSARTPRTA